MSVMCRTERRRNDDTVNMRRHVQKNQFTEELVSIEIDVATSILGPCIVIVFRPEVEALLLLLFLFSLA